MGKPEGHCLSQTDVGGPAHHGWCHHWASGSGKYKKQAEQTMGERRVNSMVSASALPGLPSVTSSNL